MATLEIVFLGLIAFVQDPNSGSPQLWALMPNTESCPPCLKESECKDGARGNYHKHKPALAFSIKPTADDASACPEPQKYPAVLPQKYWIYPIEGFSVHIEVPEGEVLSYQERLSSRLSTPDRSKPGDENAFSWVADLTQYSPDFSRVNPDCLANSPGTCAASLASRFLLTRGKVSTECLPALREDPCYRHKRMTSSNFQQENASRATFLFQEPVIHDVDDALSEGVRARIDVPANTEFTVVLTPLASGKSCVLRATFSGNAQLAVLNQEKWKPKAPCVGQSPPPHFESFRYFYSLSNASDSTCTLRRPFPGQYCGSLGSPRCPLARFTF